MNRYLSALAVLMPFSMFLLPVETMEIFAVTFALPAWMAAIVMMMEERRRGGAR